MAPPSKLAVATGSVTRLVKEEASYHKELVQQEARIIKLQSNTDDENAEYLLKQEVSANTKIAIANSLFQRQGLEETKKVLPTVREKIKKALQQLEEQLVSISMIEFTVLLTMSRRRAAVRRQQKKSPRLRILLQRERRLSAKWHNCIMCVPE